MKLDDRKRPGFMNRIAPLALASTLLLVTACGGATFRWRPSLVSHVPDSTPVRVNPQTGEPRIRGRSLGWQQGAPRLITATGDTIVLSRGAGRVEVRLKEKKGQGVLGAVIGWAVGVGVTYATCDPPRTHCGEQNPVPIWGAGLGAVIGSMFKTDDWARVRWDSP